MPKFLQLKNLGDFGVNTDLQDVDLPVEYFTSGINYKLLNGAIYTNNGSTVIGTPPAGFDATKVSRFITNGIEKYVVMGTTKVYLFDGTTWTDVTPALVVATPITGVNIYKWTMCNSGNTPIINNPQHGPFYLDQIAGIFKPLPFNVSQTWNAKGQSCGLIRSHKAFLFAMKPFDLDGTPITEDAGKNSYRWSAPADVNGLPFTWEEADLSTIAGIAYISGAGGGIVDALSLRDDFAIYSNKSIDMLTYVGGELIWNARQFTSDTGILTQNCVVELYNQHLFLSDTDILINDGNSLRSILNRKLKANIFSRIDATNYQRSFCAVNVPAKEVWTCIPESGQTSPNLAIIYNWENDKVYLRDLPAGVFDASNGPKTAAYDTFATTTDLYSTTTENYDTDVASPFNPTFSFIKKSDSKLYDVSINDGSTDYATFLERLYVPIGGYGIVTSIKSVYPIIECAGEVSIQIGSSLVIGGGVAWKPAVNFNPATMKKVDIRTTGPYQCWRIQSIGVTPFSLIGMSIEYEVNGAR
jgi:hypothetical protein